MRAPVAVLLCCIAGPGAAFDIDYAAVMAAHEAEVEDLGDGKRMLVLPQGPVRIIEMPDGAGGVRYSAMDESPVGSAGCMLGVLVDLVAGARLCEGMLEPDAVERLELALLRSARFVGVNAVPPVPEDQIAERAGALVARAVERYREGMACPGDPGADPTGASLARQASGPTFQQFQSAMHEVPRLPVPTPCF
ncbi:hypothetical protein ATO6_00330 [Oceanicola sp. 22II-s10i]|uniref:hypothetical protein n=1 Tax=Oceanicola sp. 22II-s10i TaxID=1317116 RepID=UPI000B520B05|nr:hypothetical protein [Oceanicola sp. 22II-s10i]OWU85440.1 hypothetical protein ATO6_00330 [Oceanicola sp. 22II-s10i]